jgi:hypothetical protein
MVGNATHTRKEAEMAAIIARSSGTRLGQEALHLGPGRIIIMKEP